MMMSLSGSATIFVGGLNRTPRYFDMKISGRNYTFVFGRRGCFERPNVSSGCSRFFSAESRRQRCRPNNTTSSKIPAYIWMTLSGTVMSTGYFYYKYLDTVPVTNRKRWIATSPQWECQMGESEYRKLLKSYSKQILPKDHRASLTVQRVGSRVAHAANSFIQEHNVKNISNKPYTYTVIRSDMANAFVLPNNHVFVMTGLFKYVTNEDDLAAVLGHEMAHNIVRHAGEKVSSNLLISMMARLSLLVDPSGLLFAVFVPTASIFRELPNSRIQEMEADQIGVFLAAKACYDPRAAKSVFQAMKNDEDGNSTNNSDGQSKSTGRSPPEFLSTHPSHESRISNFDEWMLDAMNIFQERDELGRFRCEKLRKQMLQARKVAALKHEQKEKYKRKQEIVF